MTQNTRSKHRSKGISREQEWKSDDVAVIVDGGAGSGEAGGVTRCVKGQIPLSSPSGQGVAVRSRGWSPER